MLLTALLVLGATMLAIVVFDVPFELWNYNRQLRMTRQEVRDELKETEGRPEVRQRIRNLQREASQRRMMQDVPKADVVITNPTHFSVALAYEDGRAHAPRVLAKGRGWLAQRIREVATQHEVPIYEAPPLARALYGSTEIGDEIPRRTCTWRWRGSWPTCSSCGAPSPRTTCRARRISRCPRSTGT
jgi:flagellar biosynthetic protein FlhB